MTDTRSGEPTLDRPASDEPSFLEGAAAPDGAGAGYRVLARKYRPQTFDDLIGQEALVRTITNAFATNRIPQAWMLTGVRGIGKTTTARILARALNYEHPDGSGSPTVEMPGLGVHCQAIMESRHIDVLEMDAASHTGVDNIRQITDGVRYAPVQARYKVYIIDEVHMLSAAAFNAFLKTLEEPPPHAKFVFATTEIRKVPVTILSRCQRFDLRRVETSQMVAHLERICVAEAVDAEPDALSTITRAAEGSVRDALSLLDQAVAHGAGVVSAAATRDMLGLADRGQVVDLFESAMRGDVAASFAVLKASYDAGADPGQMLSDLAAFTHLVTRLKLVPEAARDPALTDGERARGSDFAARLSVRTLSRAWQILLKALPEVSASQRPLAAAEMVLVRLAYAADLPTPDETLRNLRGAKPPHDPGTSRAPSPVPSALPELQPTRGDPGRLPPAPQRGGASGAGQATAVSLPTAEPRGLELRRFEDVVALAGEHREIGLKTSLERDIRLVRFEEGRIEVQLTRDAPSSLPNDLSRALGAWTGRRWVVVLSAAEGGPTLAEAKAERERERRSGAASHPLVRAVLASFPGAQIVDVRETGEPAASPPGGESELVELVDPDQPEDS